MCTAAVWKRTRIYKKSSKDNQPVQPGYHRYKYGLPGSKSSRKRLRSRTDEKHRTVSRNSKSSSIGSKCTGNSKNKKRMGRKQCKCCRICICHGKSRCRCNYCTRKNTKSDVQRKIRYRDNKRSKKSRLSSCYRKRRRGFT